MARSGPHSTHDLTKEAAVRAQRCGLTVHAYLLEVFACQLVEERHAEHCAHARPLLLGASSLEEAISELAQPSGEEL